MDILESFQYTYKTISNIRQTEFSIKYYDWVKLKENAYLNDTIVNFYCKFLENEIIPQSIKQKTYIFNTYFTSKLFSFEKTKDMFDNDQIIGHFLSCYESLKKWVKEDIFNKEYLLFPLNPPEHWSLFIVYKPLSIVEGKSGGCLLYLDSFGVIDVKLSFIIRLYLQYHYNQNTKIKQENVKEYQLIVPR